MGYPKDGDDYMPDNPEFLMDLVANELERQGLVKITFLDEELADGEPDYLIELTEEGIEKMIDGEEPVSRDLEL
jgi:hypothetical protein